MASQLCIEIGTAGGETTTSEDVVIGQRNFRCVIRELIGVPPGLIIIAVHVNRPENSECIGDGQLMLEGMAGEDGVALFDVDLDFFFQTITLQEAIDRTDIEIILVFCGLLRFWFNQDRSLETNLIFIIYDHRHKPSHLVQFMINRCVQQCFISFATAPQHIICPTELSCCVKACLNGGGGKGKDIWIRVGRCACHVSTVGKQVCCSPQQLCPGLLHFLGKVVGHLLKICCVFSKILTLGAHIRIVKAEEGCAKQMEHFKGNIGLVLCGIHRAAGPVFGEPRPFKGCATKRVIAWPDKIMPVAHRKSEVVLHALTK